MCTQTKKSVQGTHLEIDTLPCLVVELSGGKKEESVRKKDISLSAEKESLKGSRKDRLLERARKKSGKNDIKVSNKKNLKRVLEVESSSRRSQRVIPHLALCPRGITSSSLRGTPVLAAGFQLEGNLYHITKSCITSRST